MTVHEQEQQIRAQLDESLPDIIEALKLKIHMFQREIETAVVYGGKSFGNALHIHNCEAELSKAQQLLRKLEK